MNVAVTRVEEHANAFMKNRKELIDYLKADPAASRVHATLEIILEEYTEVNKLAPEYRAYQKANVNDLTQVGNIMALYAQEGKFREFRARYDGVRALLDLSDESLEAMVRPAIRQAGSLPLASLSEKNLRHFFEMKEREVAASLAAAPAPEDLAQDLTRTVIALKT